MLFTFKEITLLDYLDDWMHADDLHLLLRDVKYKHLRIKYGKKSIRDLLMNMYNRGILKKRTLGYESWNNHRRIKTRNKVSTVGTQYKARKYILELLK